MSEDERKALVAELSQEFPLSEKTGLPFVSSNHRWKVQIHWGSMEYYPTADIKLQHKKGPFWFTDGRRDKRLVFLDPRDEEGQIRKHAFLKAETSDYPELILDAAWQILDGVKNSISSDKYYAEYRDASKKLNGIYPPKKLP